MTAPLALDLPRRFLIVDDHPLFRDALRSALRASFPDAEIEEAASIESARSALAGSSDVDLILLDLSLQRFDNFEGLVRLRKEYPFVPVLVVSGLEEPKLVYEALCLGASGFVPKASGKAALSEAILAVLGGAIYVPQSGDAGRAAPKRAEKDLSERIASLTPAQGRVLAMVRQGLLNREIATELGIGESTVKAHVSEIIRKLGVMSRTQIVIETARHDLAVAQAAREKC
ncbi:DNA-binding response regulator [Methylopila jiangsuensis]|uniref:DNA-binding response regulator n=1 Tax=Methylopila jiangsuensis TaxID=586230 RepID=A0A9W6N383_9HYPH|nr:response regulator transcription factor [Methylopila jiangsuensis]MDR6286902.1 DNA-binding NarL/FixJ family response regulator [Methylopila jiangsuensis]GLK76749.1 DNA-binding response regulator [Methylopila jiangsuensis]